MGQVEDWALSGGIALTGRADGPPVLPPGRAASTIRERLAELGVPVSHTVIGERAAYARLTRRGPWSCGGAFRVLTTLDGHVGVSLPRPEDLSLVPALVEDTLLGDPWDALTSWASTVATADAEARLHLLGPAGGSVPTTSDGVPADRSEIVTTAPGRRQVRDDPLIVDLTGLWAGPLCAHLLGLRGCRVVKVESTQRPDGAQRGPTAFYDLLHSGHSEVRLDFETELDQLRALLGKADLVLESSRPRALRHWGIIAEEIVTGGALWLSITARWDNSDAIGFGDGIAASAGLVVDEGSFVLPVADALADPLTGVVAAAADATALASEDACVIDVSMLHAAAATYTGSRPAHEVRRRGDDWWVSCDEGEFVIRAPVAR